MTPPDPKTPAGEALSDARGRLTRIVVAHNRLHRSEITPQEFDEYALGMLSPPASDAAPSGALEMEARAWIATHYPAAVDTNGADRLVHAFAAGAAGGAGEAERLLQALRDVLDPIAAMQRECPPGHELNHAAITMGACLQYIQTRVRNVLAAAPKVASDAGAGLDKRKAVNTIIARHLHQLQPDCPDMVERIRLGNEACTAILALATDATDVDALTGCGDDQGLFAQPGMDDATDGAMVASEAAGLAEKIARIIDPLVWRDRDSYVRIMQATPGCAPETIADQAHQRVRHSLRTAHDVLAALAASPSESATRADHAQGGGEVDYAEAARVMFEACRDRFMRSEQCYPAIDALAAAGFIATGGDALEQAVKYMRHDPLCGVIGGYNECTCGMDAAREVIRNLSPARDGAGS